MHAEKGTYILVRAATYFIRWLPYSWIHVLGRGLGRLAFRFMRVYRKRALSNLTLAKDLNISSEKELLHIARKSFQNLAINVLEYSRFDRETDFSRVIRCENPEAADELYKQGKGIIFFCGHQANWEALFLDGTSRMNGIAIGKPIKNKRLYNWILSIRQKKGGQIVAPRNAVREGLRALRKGSFIGIVGDQGMPDSGYSFPFLGRRAWTSTAPALLAYKTNSPIIVATTRRSKGGYRITYSDPIWPRLDETLELEVVRMMDQALTLLQESILRSPGEWLWQHNRWKQQTPQIVYKRFRHDSICVILPEKFEPMLSHLPMLRKIYPLDFLCFVAPERARHFNIEADEMIFYREPREILRRDYRFKLVYNFSGYPVAKHYEKFSVFEVIDLAELRALAPQADNLSEILKQALCRHGTVFH